MDDMVDRSFGICYENGHFMMGDKILKVYGDNIMLVDEVFVGTSGPKTYTKEDYERYKELLHETNVMYGDYDPKSSYCRAFQQKGIVHSNDDEKYFSGDGLYLQKNGRCFNIRRIGTGIYLRPCPMLAGVYGNGLYIPRGSSIYDGEGLLLGP